jgi:plasmid stabilization system protein ParE
MRFSFHPEAEAEFNDAIDYYEDKEGGLGYDFAVEVYATIQRITAFPKAWPVMKNDIRRSLVRRFPYGVLYFEKAEEIMVIAVMHLHRNPEYWEHRV